MNKKLYELEHLVNNGGSQEEIDKMRAEIGISIQKKKSKDVQESKLTVQIYQELKKKGKSDSFIQNKFNLSQVKFYNWKKKNDLINSRKGREKTISLKQEKSDSVDSAVILKVEPEGKIEPVQHYPSPIDMWTFANQNFNQSEIIGYHRLSALNNLIQYGYGEKEENVNELRNAIVSIEKLIELEVGR